MMYITKHLDTFGRLGADVTQVYVDASLTKDKGLCYRGVVEPAGQWFLQGPYPDGSSNIGEFLAIMTAAELLLRSGTLSTTTIRTDSNVALAWLGNKSVPQGALDRLPKESETRRNTERFVRLLQTGRYDGITVVNHDNIEDGQNLADFGNKGKKIKYPVRYHTSMREPSREASVKLTPRTYQAAAVDAMVTNFTQSKHTPGIVVIPTGGGKSVVIAEVARRLHEPMLVLQPSKEILFQNHKKFTDMGYDAGIFSASAGEKKVEDVTFGMIGSVKNAMQHFDRFKYAIVDECHLMDPKGKNYTEFLSTMRRLKMNGLTATPYRLFNTISGPVLKMLTSTSPRFFSEVLYSIDQTELLSQGHLAKTIYVSGDFFDRRKIKTNSTGTEFDDAALQEYMDEVDFTEKLVKTVKKLLDMGRKHILVFTRFVKQAEEVADALGNLAYFVSGETKQADRDRVLAGFKEGKRPVMANCGVLTTGFDFPQLDTIVMGRATKSLSLWYQIVGRGQRPHPSKDYCLVADMCWNAQEFGKVEDLKLLYDERGKPYIHNGIRRITNVVPAPQDATAGSAIGVQSFDFAQTSGNLFYTPPKQYQFIK